jgi:hypothetical protein
MIKWERKTGQYACSEVLYAGQWDVGKVNYDSATSIRDKNKYVAYCKLPGIKETLGHFETEQEAKTRLESAVKHWMCRLEAGHE